jgi:mannosylglycerate hydrolase
LFWRQQGSPRRWKLILVSHTHWDREWYLPFQVFRARLVQAVDFLLDLMVRDPAFKYFTLDGQTILLEDYLEVRSERERELRERILEGRILIGPWYILPDEFLVSGESLVRNLLEGRRIGTRFGPIMKIGYLPDPFGHIAQMPQVLRGFGIGDAVLWRGTGNRVASSETIWQAPDGSEVLLQQMPGGYDNASLLPADGDALVERLSHIRAELEPRATTDYLLLMNGDDHMFPQEDVPAIIELANRRLNDAEMIHGTLPMLFERIREDAAAKGVEWARVEGEFRSPELSHLLAGILSTRMPLKQRNTACQNLLERWAEPFGCFAGLAIQAADAHTSAPDGRGRDSSSLLRMAWRYLLANQTHDGISGCSVDQVHEEMASRYDWCQQIGELVSNTALATLTDLADTESLLSRNGGHGAVAVFNSEAGPRTDFVACTTDLPGGADDAVLVAPDGRHVPFQVLKEHRIEVASATLTRNEIQGYLRLSGPGRSWPHWKLRILDKIVRTALRGRMPQLVVAGMDVTPGDDPASVEVMVEVRAGDDHDYDALSVGMRQLSNLVDRGDAEFFRVRVHRRDQIDVGFVAPDVPGHGMKLFAFRSGAQPRPPQPHVHDGYTLENEYFSLQISPEDGAIRLVDRETGAIYWGINCFVDSGDAGDEYTFSPPAIDRQVEGPDGPPVVTIEEQGPVRQVARVDFALRLPVSLTEDRQARSEETALCPVTTRITVYPGVPRIDVQTTVTNNACDHRLRVHFPTHLDSHCSHADGQFAVIQRPIESEIAGENWMEKPVATHPQLSFVDISDGESGLMIANRGLPEYEVTRGERGVDVALTLLRCVGWLSRDDLATRQGAAGPLLATPGAQMKGTYSFEYSIIPHAGSWESAIHHAYSFARPMMARWTARHGGTLGPEESFVQVSPSSLLVSSVKSSEDGAGDVVLRLYNASNDYVEGRVKLFFPMARAELATLAEAAVQEIDVEDGGALKLDVRPHKIVTIRVRPAQR